MAFEPIKLVSPDGRDYTCDSAVEFNNLINKGYTPKQNVKPETVLAKAAESDKSSK
jgi:hypothetical protein